jgi:hypothetical protein
MERVTKERRGLWRAYKYIKKISTKISTEEKVYIGGVTNY